MSLEINDIHTYYGDSYVLQGVSLKVDPGQIVALMGRNGVGKTTTIRSIVGFSPPERGTITFKDLDITKMPSHEIAKEGIAIATFAAWWGYKHEAWDAIPWNAVMAMRKGVRVAIKSDSDDFARRLNQEAGKTMRYGGATEEEALRMITLNPAWIIGVDDRVGSIDVGKDADLVIWDGYPLSNFARADQVFIDGDLYFDRSLPGYGMPQYKEGN